MSRIRALVLIPALLLVTAPAAFAVSVSPSRRFGPRRFPLYLVLSILLGTLPLCLTALAAEGSGSPRPRVALVLSGGGARGAAHVGVLKVLEEMRVPVDLIVGTSMGSIVGGFYATGWDPAEIETMMTGMNWRELFVDRVARGDRTFRRKQDDIVFLVAARLRFKGWKPYLPPALLGGQRLELLLRSLEIQTTAETDFDRFPIPYRAVAADLATGEGVVLDHGGLATALRASMSIAGVFPPVEIEGRKLVDGGAAANLPVRIARQLGAERIIAVDITSPLTGEEGLGSVFSIVGQMSGLLTAGNRVEDLRNLRPGDVLIQPDLGDITFTDFDRAEEAVGIGEKTARLSADRLRSFTVDEAEYARFQERHHRRPAAELRVDQVRLENSSWVDDRLVRGRLPLRTGQPFDEAAVNKSIIHLSGLDYFGVIRDEFQRQDGRGVLTVFAPGKPHGKNSLQFGFSFQDDFHGENSYSLSVRHLLLAANRRGGEWENVGQIGDRSLLRSVFYQPLDWGMKWFVAPGAEVLRENQTLWEESNPVADFRIQTNLGRLDLGRVLGEWGDVRLGGYDARNLGEVRVGPQVIPDYDERDAGLRLSFRMDTREATVFPRRGASVSAWYTHSRENFGADADRAQACLVAQNAFSFGRNTIVPGVEALKTLEGEATLASSYTLGGLFRLSGLGPKQLVAESGGLARLAYYRELSRIDLGPLSSRVYAGASLETGNVYDPGAPVTWGSLRHSGSIYLGAQTPIGPAFLGGGFADGGERRLYFMIGQRF